MVTRTIALLPIKPKKPPYTLKKSDSAKGIEGRPIFTNGADRDMQMNDWGWC